ncbi:hypothetical protein BC937DRAFT_93513 [Endogone sp. FLAS-F59071]|nr:hypothetical protein BC937DRAFT_93513 [Endogone sp. FLAS-F59071]|eukprot:RUS14643.1 hypothetical protein BC937DRAFT_93513 [Endogone sp. FLAS-F59071]
MTELVIYLSDTEVSLQQRSTSALHYLPMAHIQEQTDFIYFILFYFGQQTQDHATSFHDIRANPIDMEDEGRLILNRRREKPEHQKDGKRALEKQQPKQPKKSKQPKRARETHIIREACHLSEANENRVIKGEDDTEMQLCASVTPDSSDKEEANNTGSSSSTRREKGETPLKRPKRGPARQFTHAEDTRLMDAVCRHGASWTKVAAEVGNLRTADTCNKRYRVLVKYAFKGAGWIK